MCPTTSPSFRRQHIVKGWCCLWLVFANKLRDCVNNRWERDCSCKERSYTLLVGGIENRWVSAAGGQRGAGKLNCAEHLVV